MDSKIRITTPHEHSAVAESAQRIALLLESTFQDSDWVAECDGSVSLTEFLEHPERILIKGDFSGTVNGSEFSIPFERDYLISQGVSAQFWIGSPIVAFFLAAFSWFYNENNPEKNLNDWRARSEFEVASKIEAKINRLVGAPVAGARLIWWNALRFGLIMFLVGTLAMSIYLYTHPHPRRPNAEMMTRWATAIFGSALFTGLPFGLGGIFASLVFVGPEIEASVAGQSLLRLIGVKSVTGLRVVSVIGVIVCWGGALAFAKIIMMYR